jgi:hypothetical protein
MCCACAARTRAVISVKWGAVFGYPLPLQEPTVINDTAI